MSSKVSATTLKGSAVPSTLPSTKRMTKAKKVKATAVDSTTIAPQEDDYRLPSPSSPPRVGDSIACDDPTMMEDQIHVHVHVVPPSSPVTLKETESDPDGDDQYPEEYQYHPGNDEEATDSNLPPGESVPSEGLYPDDDHDQDDDDCSEECEDEEEEISSEELGEEEEDLEDDDVEYCNSDATTEEDDHQPSNSRKPLPQHRPQLPIAERTYNNKRRGRTPGSAGCTLSAASVLKRVRGAGFGIRSKCATVGNVGSIVKSKSISQRKSRGIPANQLFYHNSSSSGDEGDEYVDEEEEVEDEEGEDELGDEYQDQESGEEDDDGLEPPGFLLSSNRDPSSIQNIPIDAQQRLEAFFEAAGFTDGKLMSDPESLRKLTLTVSSALGEASAAINRMRDSQRKSIEEGRSDSLEEGDSLLALACSSGYFELARVLLAMGANVDDRGSKGDLTPLMDAASQGHVEIVRLLLSHGAEVNAQSACGNSALMYACASGHVSVVEDLLKAGAHVEDNNENGHTPLMEAASAGHVPVAKLLLNHGAGINTHSNEFKESALTVACYKGHLEMVRFLLEAGADQQHKTDEMHTALMEASMDGHVEVARLLLDSGAQVNMPADSFESPLTLAACGGHVELAELLLERGANIEEVNDEGYTPLMEAAREGHLCVVKTLIQHHAIVNAKTEETQETALTLAACGGFLDVVDLMLRAGADIELGASTPLMEAAQEGHIQVVRFLIEKGADIFHENAAHDIALSFAAENGHLEILQLFVDLGCNPEHLSEGGRSPLMKAARGGHIDVIKYLLEKKAEVNRQTTSNDHTPLSMACAGGHLTAVQLLISVGANLYHKLKDNSTMVIEAARGGHTAVMKCLMDYLPPNSKAAAARAQAAKQGPVAKSPATAQTAKTPMDPKLAAQAKASVLRKCRSTSTLDSTAPPTVASANEADEDAAKRQLLLEAIHKPPVTTIDRIPHPCDSQRHLPGGDVCADDKVIGQPLKLPGVTTGVAKKHPITGGVCQDCSKNTCIQQTLPPSAPGHVHVKRPAAAEAVPGTQQSTSITAGIVTPTSPSAFTPLPSTGPPLVASQVTAATAISERPKLKSKPRKTSQLQSQSAGTSPGSSSEKSQVGSPGSPVAVSQTATPGTPVGTMTKPTIQATPTSSGSMVHQVVTSGGQIEIPKFPDSTLPFGLLPEVKFDKNDFDQILAQHRAALFQGQGNLDHVTANLGSGGTTTTTTVVVTHGNGETETIFDGENLPPGANEVIMNAAAAAFPIDCFPLPSTMQMGHSGEVHVQSYQVGSTGENTTTMQTTTIINAATSLNNFQQQILLPHHPPPLPAAIAAAAAAAGLVPPSGAPPPGALKGLTKKETMTQAPPPPKTMPVAHVQQQPPKISGTSAPPGQARIPVNQVPPVASLAAPVGQKKQLAKRSRPVAQGGTCSRQSNQQTQTHAHSHAHGKHNQSVASTQTTITGQQVNPHHFDVNHATESSGETSLSIAAASGHYEVVEFLLGRKANIEHRDKKGCTPLILAADSGYDKVVELLLSKNAELEAQSERTKDTALSLACTKGRFEVVEVLLKKGANKEHRNVSDYTPLSLAASGGYVNIIKLLLQHGAEINSRTGSKLGISPLMLAAMNGNTTAVKLLLDMGSDINAQIETNKNTALTLACFQGRQEVVSLLLERKANLEHRAKTGLTPLMEAANGGYTEVGRILIEKGADVNAAPVPATKDTALTIAADKGHYRFVELLLSKHAMVEVRNKKGCTPMWLACNGGHLDVAQILFKHRADLDVQDNRKVSCLMTAFRKGHVKLIRWIVKNVQQFPSDGEMLRFYASIQGEAELLKKCEQCGEFIKQAKDKQALEANKNASILLEELDMEKSREESKRQAAARRREKKKKKKLEKRQGPSGEHDDDDYDQDDDEDEGINTIDSGIDANSLGSNSSATGKNKENLSTKMDIIEEPGVSAKSRKRRNRKEREKQSQATSLTKAPAPMLIEPMQEIKPTVSAPVEAKDVLREKDNKMAGAEGPIETKSQKKDKKSKREEMMQTGKDKEPSVTATKISPSASTYVSSKKGNKTLAEKDYSQYFEPPTQPSSRKIAASFDTTDNPIFSVGYTQVPFGKSTGSGSGTGKSGRKDDGWKEVTRSFPSSRSKKVMVPSSVISRVIGRGGCNINAIREATGAHIEVEKQQKGQVQLERTIQIKGTVESTKQAFSLITSLMNDPDLDLKRLMPLSSSISSTSTTFATGMFSVPVTSSSQRASTNTSASSTISPTFDNIPFSTFVASTVSTSSKGKSNKQTISPPVTTQVASSIKKPTPTTDGAVINTSARGMPPTSKAFGHSKPIFGTAPITTMASSGFVSTTVESNTKTTHPRGSISSSNGLVALQPRSATPTVSTVGSISSSGSPVPSSSPSLVNQEDGKMNFMSGISGPLVFTNTMLVSPTPTKATVGPPKETMVSLVSSTSPVRNLGCNVIAPPGRSNSVAETTTEPLASTAQSQGLEYSPFNYTFSNAPSWGPGDLPPGTGTLSNFGSPTSQNTVSPLGQIGSGLTHNPMNSSAARAMNFASVAASGISATSLSTATAQMTHAGGQQNGNLVGTLGGGLSNSVSLGGKGICDGLLDELPKGDASKAPGYRGTTVGSPVLRPLQQNTIPCTSNCVDGSPMSSQFPGMQQPSGGILNMGTGHTMGFGGPGRNPGMNMGTMLPNYGMGGFGQEMGSGLMQGGYNSNSGGIPVAVGICSTQAPAPVEGSTVSTNVVMSSRLNPRAPSFTLPQHSKMGSPTQPTISTFQQTIPPMLNQQLQNSFRMNNNFAVRNNTMLPPGAGRQATSSGLNLQGWNPYGNDSSVVDLQNLAVLAASTGTLDPQMLFGVDPIGPDNGQQKQMKPDGRLPRPIGGERAWKNAGGTVGNSSFGGLDGCMDPSQVSPPQTAAQQSLPGQGQGWLGSVYAPPQFAPMTNQNPNNALHGNHQRVGDARNFMGRRCFEEIDPNRIPELQQMIDGQNRMMNGGPLGPPGPPPMHHIGGNMQHPGMMFSFGPPIDNLEPHLTTKVDHTNSWDGHFHMEDKHNMGWNSKWGN